MPILVPAAKGGTELPRQVYFLMLYTGGVSIERFLVAKEIAVSKRVKPVFLVVALVLLLGALPLQAKSYDYVETLGNGVKVVVHSSFAAPTVSLNIFLNVGGFEEKEATLGISHFYEHLFFRGTTTCSGSQFKRSIESLGGAANANTSRDMTHYFVNMPKEYAAQGITLLADALVNTELDPEAIDQERHAVLEELRINSDNPVRIMTDKLYVMAYGHHPYAQPVIGTEENIRGFQRDDFVSFRDTYYTPERTTVVIVGDVSPGEIMPVVREQFGRFTRPHSRPVLRPGRVVPPAQEIAETCSTKAQSSFVVLGFIGPSVKDRPDIYSTDVMSFLIGVGKGALLKRKLVDEGKALDSGLEFLTQRFPGLIMLYAIVPPGEELKAKEELEGVIRQVCAGDFSDKDFERARNYLVSNYALGGESNAGKADTLGFYSVLDDLTFVDSYVDRVKNVTRADVIATAKKYLGGGCYALVVKAPAPRQAASDESGEDDSSAGRRAEPEPGRERPGDWSRCH